MSKEEAPTLAAGALAAGSVRLEGEIGTRAHEHPDSETILAKATMQLNRHAAESSLILRGRATSLQFQLHHAGPCTSSVFSLECLSGFG